MACMLGVCRRGPRKAAFWNIAEWSLQVMSGEVLLELTNAWFLLTVFEHMYALHIALGT